MRSYKLPFVFRISFPVICVLFAACARAPRVTPQAALDYGQFVVRELPPDADVSALRGKRIVIDPGHGGAFAGAVGPNNLREADVNLGVGLYLWGMLSRAGAEAYLTRTDDSTVYKGDDLTLKKDLQARAEFAETHDADLFLSLHHNADVLPGAKKNSLETYFKMDDPGPSLDVARYVHRQLALSLEQRDNAIYPGNFHVLRENRATAILGEPSYITHADNAFRLGLAPMQRVEAQAYFLGILEYFSLGVPQVEFIEPEGPVTDNPLPLITARVVDDRGVGIDPASIKMTVDDSRVEPQFDAGWTLLRYLPSSRLSNGKHQIRVSVRNLNGNSSKPEEHNLEILIPPAFISLHSDFPALRAGSSKPVRLSAKVLDRDLLPVADGTHVEFSATAGTVFPAVSQTVRGEAVVYLTPELAEASNELIVKATASGVSHSIKLRVTEDAPEIFIAKIFDAKTGLPIRDALVTLDGIPVGHSDRSGYFAVSAKDAEATRAGFSKAGYISQEADLSGWEDTVLTIRLAPVANGVLFGKKIALDPQFGGQEKGITGPTGVRASDLNLLLAEYLAQLLRGVGAEAMLVREFDETVSLLNRVERAEQFGAELFISIGHGDAANGPKEKAGEPEPSERTDAVLLKHYPTSEPGKRLATSIGLALKGQGIADTIIVAPDSSFVLTHTSSPAVIVVLPGPDTPEMEEKLRRPANIREEARAVYLGNLQYMGAIPEQ